MQTCQNIELDSGSGGTLSTDIDDGKGDGNYVYSQLTNADACGDTLFNNGETLQCYLQDKSAVDTNGSGKTLSWSKVSEVENQNFISCDSL